MKLATAASIAGLMIAVANARKTKSAPGVKSVNKILLTVESETKQIPDKIFTTLSDPETPM
jgi:hypothetical protein